MHTASLDTRHIKARAQHSWPAILAGLGIDPRYLQNRHGPCPACGGKDRFRFDDREGQGTFYCNQCGSGDGFHLLERVHGWSFRDALQAVAHWLGMVTTGTVVQPRLQRLPPRVPLPATPVDPVETDRRRQRLQQVWDESLPVGRREAEPLRDYLRWRGLTPPIYPDSLRLHPSLPYFDAAGARQGDYPTMIALGVGATGQPVTLHRTYLTATGVKAPVRTVKKLMAYPADRVLSGGAIRLFPAGAVLGIAEGIETALAVHQATGLPIWAAGSAALLQPIVIPAEVRTVLIWADRDCGEAGQRAAAALIARLQRQRLYAIALLPPGPLPAGANKIDWLDVLVSRGPTAIASVLRHHA
ncbi:MAG: toprim domain-containing protein [Candidatus Competibacteraceae bacterium]